MNTMNTYRSFGDWDIIRSLGEGGFGEVHHWKNRVTKQEIATKSLKPNGKLKPDEIAILKKRWLQEFNWMQSLKTPYIVAAINLPDKEFLSYLQGHNYWQALPVIVMEYCDGGDLRSRLERVEHLNGLHEHEIRNVLRTLRHAVEYLHVECNIEHRDIKPENIVIHRSKNGNVYKLTDFGYAREIPENTIAQSVVGTRHYVAPEVIDPGSYTKTVDYWSVGVMVFELVCGVRPFIPHKGFPIILTNVLNKPKNCIAITQKFETTQEADSYDFEETIFPQNICSPIFIKKTEEWLKLALDGDYRTRGSDRSIHKFYKDLDSILATNIISVFILSSYQFYFYDVNAFKNVGELFAKLSSDCGIKQNNMHLTLPTAHPKGSLREITEPRDFFVGEWSDSSNAENPAAMLYVTDVTRGQCDCNVHREQTEKNVSRTIFTCLGMDKKKYDKVPIWLLEQLERHIHSLLGNEQRYLECYLKGLYEFIITIEDEVFRFEDKIRKIYEETLILCGRVKQFEYTVKKNAQTQNFQIWLERAQSYRKKCQLLKDDVVVKITTRHKSILRHCKDLASKDIFKTLPNEDIFKVNYFRKFLVEARGCNFLNSQRMSKCIELFDEWTNKMSKFPPMDLNSIHVEIVGQYELFRKIQENINGFALYMEKFEKELESDTENIMQTLTQNDQQQLVLKMSSLHMDGNSLGAMSLSGSSTFSWTNGICHVNGGGDDNSSVLKLIEETIDITNNIRSVWGIDDDHVMCVDDTTVDIPTTINDI